MAEQTLKAQFFVTRKDGKMVPLVAVDELPHHIAVASVSRVMSPFDISGMTCIGRSEFRHRHYLVKNAPELAASNTTNGRDALTAKYFVTRDSGNMVPMLAMDEMPEHFVIEGVPRSISVFEIAGMTCAGIGETREQVHTVEDVNNAPMSYFTGRVSPESASVRSESVPSTPVVRLGPPSNEDDVIQSVDDENTPPSLTSNASTPSAFYVESERTSSGSPLNFDTPESTSRPSSGAGNNQTVKTPEPTEIKTAQVTPVGMKKYCSYWIRHGECDYQQQGCLYKHEMPLDAETLGQLGLRDIPRWYREKHCLGSFLAAGGAGASFSGPGLKSAVAAGVHQQDTAKVMNNWRNGQGNATRPTLSGAPRGISNVYSPRNPPFTMSPHSFSRFPAAKNPVTFADRALAELQNRQQVDTPHDIRAQEQAHTGQQQIDQQNVQGGAVAGNDDVLLDVLQSPGGHWRHRSASTIISDIEALVNRQDTERRAKEDADYAKVCEEAKRKKAVENAKTALETKSDSVRGSDNSERRGAHRGWDGRGRGRVTYRSRGRGGRIA